LTAERDAGQVDVDGGHVPTPPAFVVRVLGAMRVIDVPPSADNTRASDLSGLRRWFGLDGGPQTELP
jgi:hypothetical protein